MTALQKTINSLKNTLPILVMVLLFISLAINLIPEDFYSQAFSGGLLDPFIGAILGSIAAGNPSTSYVIGGELIGQGVNFAAITAFLVAWVTVGAIQFPAESVLLGKKFALTRNAVALVSAIAVALLTSATLEVIS